MRSGKWFINGETRRNRVAYPILRVVVGARGCTGIRCPFVRYLTGFMFRVASTNRSEKRSE